MLLFTQAGNIFKNQKEAPDPVDHTMVLGRTKGGEERKESFLECNVELVANKRQKNAEMDFWRKYLGYSFS